MKFALFIGAAQGIIAGFWFEEIGISILGSIPIAFAIAHSWYHIAGGR